MPSGPTAPCSLASLLPEFRPRFTAPTFQTFIGLVVGADAPSNGVGMLTGAGLDRTSGNACAPTRAEWRAAVLGWDWRGPRTRKGGPPSCPIPNR